MKSRKQTMSDLTEKLKTVPHSKYCKAVLWNQECDCSRKACIKAIDEIERLNKRHDDFLQEFWATNAQNAKLQAVVDALRAELIVQYVEEYAALKEADDE